MHISHVMWAVAATLAFSLCAQPQQSQKVEGSVPASPINLTLQHGRLTATFRNQSLRSVAEYFKRVTQVDIILAQGLDESPVSADYNGILLEEALRNLLVSYDTFFFYGGSDSQPPSLRTIWVYPKGSASALKPVGPEQWAGSRELELALGDNDPEVRAQAYEALIPRPDRHNLILDALTGARERDPNVRERLLSSSLTRGVAIPVNILGDLARTDSSEHVRWLALDSLVDQPSAKYVAEAALSDASEIVRTRAKELLIELNRREKGAPGSEPELQTEKPQ